MRSGKEGCLHKAGQQGLDALADDSCQIVPQPARLETQASHCSTGAWEEPFFLVDNEHLCCFYTRPLNQHGEEKKRKEKKTPPSNLRCFVPDTSIGLEARYDTSCINDISLKRT